MVVFSNLGRRNGVRHFCILVVCINSILFMCLKKILLDCVYTFQLGLLYTTVENTLLRIICLCVCLFFHLECCVYTFQLGLLYTTVQNTLLLIVLVFAYELHLYCCIWLFTIQNSKQLKFVYELVVVGGEAKFFRVCVVYY